VRERAGAAAREGAQRARAGGEARRGQGERGGVGGAVHDGAREALRSRRRRRGRGRAALPRGTGRLRHAGVGVEQEPPELDHRHPVDHAVVRLPDDPDLAAGQPVRDPHLPQRPVARERGRQHGVDDRAEVAAIGGQEVLGRVEVRVVDPHGLVQAERDGGQALAVARRVLEPRGEVREEVAEGRARPVLRRVVKGDPADVHRRGGAFDREEGGVEGGQALRAHAWSPSSGRQWSAVSRAGSRVSQKSMRTLAKR
jgi:hypothetical protein